MSSNCKPPDQTTVHLVANSERDTLPGKPAAKVLPFPREALHRNWRQGNSGSVVPVDLADARHPDDLLRFARIALQRANPMDPPAFQFFSREILKLFAPFVTNIQHYWPQIVKNMTSMFFSPRCGHQNPSGAWEVIQC